jgi:hypothetical protein
MDNITTQSVIDPVALEAISAFVQQELIAKPKLNGAVTDLSALVGPGMDSIKIPRYGSFVAERKLGATKLSAQKLDPTADQLYLNKQDAVYTEVENIAQLQSSVGVLELYSQRIASAIMKKWDYEIYTELALASSSSPDHQVAYASGSALTKADFTNSKKLLRAAEVDVDSGDLYLCCNETQEAVLLGLADFVDADKWFSGAEQVKMNGLIGKAYGFQIIIGTQYSAPVFFHKSACAFAVQAGMQFMQAPLPQALSVGLSAWHNYGVKQLQGGKAAVKIGS